MAVIPTIGSDIGQQVDEVVHGLMQEIEDLKAVVEHLQAELDECDRRG